MITDRAAVLLEATAYAAALMLLLSAILLMAGVLLDAPLLPE